MIFSFLLFLRKNEKTPETLDFTGFSGGVFGVPEVIRTPDLPLRRRSLYPAELRKHIFAFGGQARRKLFKLSDILFGIVGNLCACRRFRCVVVIAGSLIFLCLGFPALQLCKSIRYYRAELRLGKLA